ncbi:sulfatase-like hydrolase/transferase [candidate division KSB1 bacterium]
MNTSGKNTKGEINRRDFLKSSAAITLSAPFLNLSCSKGIKRPNIILIMADDLGYECLSSYGGTSYNTPFLDELADTGVRFGNCYSTPLCTPSRVQIMTGKYNFRNYTEFGNLRPGEVTFAHLLKNAGYKTCIAGKWQLAGHYEGSNYKGVGTYPENSDFDEYFLWQVDKLGSRFWDPVLKKNGKIVQNLKNRYAPDVFCEYINDFVKRNRTGPFFVYYPMVLTHAPFIPTPDSNVEPENRKKGNKKYFGDMVSYMDKIVGRIIENLDELGIRENTLVIFTGDNGSPRNITSQIGGQSIKGGKGLTIEAGIHVPLIVNWKGNSPKGTLCDDLIDFTDFLPTLLETVQFKIPDDFIFDGRSFLPQILGKMGNPREWIFCYYDPKWGRWGKKRYVMNKRWKLYENGRLFDIKDDPLENKPLIVQDDSEETGAVRKELKYVLDSMK